MDPRSSPRSSGSPQRRTRAKRQRMKDESAGALAAHFSHPANQADLVELAFDLVNLAWADAMTEDIVPQIIEVKTVGLGDTDYIDDDLRGMRAYWQGKGGQILSDVLRYERTSCRARRSSRRSTATQDEFASNFWGSFDKLRAQANEKVRQAPVQRLVELVRAAITSGNYYGTFAASTLTVARSTRSSTRSSPAPARQVSILGSPMGDCATSPTSASSTATRRRTRSSAPAGSASTRARRSSQVENFEDFAGNFVLPNNELWIVGKKAGRLTYYGDSAKVQILQLPSFMRRWETARDAGMLLYGAPRLPRPHRPDVIGRRIRKYRGPGSGPALRRSPPQ
jgi:hypothetical protein